MDNSYQMDVLIDSFLEISLRRDGKLGEIEQISSARMKVLHDALIREFPLNMALQIEAARRDQLLDEDQSSIPAKVKANLRHKAETMRDAEDLPGTYGLNLFGLFQFPARMAVIIGSIAIAGLLYFGAVGVPKPKVTRSNLATENQLSCETGATQWNKSAQDQLHVKQSLRFGTTDRTGFVLNHLQRIPTPRDQFNLRVTDTELVCLRTAFLMANGIRPTDTSDQIVGIRLDLPVQPILFDGDTTGTP